MTALTKSSFELIAQAMKNARADILAKESPTVDLLDGVGYASEHLADALASTNPRFDRARFLAACGVTEGR